MKRDEWLVRKQFLMRALRELPLSHLARRVKMTKFQSRKFKSKAIILDNIQNVNLFLTPHSWVGTRGEHVGDK